MNAATNATGFVWTHVFRFGGHVNGSELPGHTGTFCWAFRGSANSGLELPLPFVVPPATREGSGFSTSSPAPLIAGCLDSSPPAGHEVASPCGFDVRVPSD